MTPTPDSPRLPAMGSHARALAPGLALVAQLTIIGAGLQPHHDVEDWRRTTIALEPLDVLVLHTDGVFDAVGAGFGEERLRSTLMGGADAQDAAGRIDAALSAFEVGPRADDTAVLAVQRVGVAAQPVSARGQAAGTGDDEAWP